MSLTRFLLPAVQQAPRLTSRNPAARRLFNKESSPVLASSHAKVIGARTGHVQGDDLVVDLTMPKALGGRGEKWKTNPEELFAAGYGACSESAMNANAAALGIKMPNNPEDSIVDTTVHLIGDLKQLDLGIRVDMKIRVRGVEKSKLEALVEKTKLTCPYSRAIEGNVTTNYEVHAL